MNNPETTQDHINRIIEFRHTINANGFGKQRDALSEVLDLICAIFTRWVIPEGSTAMAAAVTIETVSAVPVVFNRFGHLAPTLMLQSQIK